MNIDDINGNYMEKLLLTIGVFLLAIPALAGDANAAIQSYWNSNISKVKVPQTEQTRLGPFSLGQVFLLENEESIRKIPNAACSLKSKITGKEDFDFNYNGGGIYCTTQILGELRELELVVTRLSLVSNNPDYNNFVVGMISLSMFNPNQITLDAMGDAVTHRWGFPQSATHVREKKQLANKMAVICDSEIGPLETFKERIAREECRSSLSMNPLVQFITNSGNSDVTEFTKNGVKVLLQKKHIQFMMVNGFHYTILIQTKEFEKFIDDIEKINAAAAKDAEKIKRNNISNNF